MTWKEFIISILASQDLDEEATILIEDVEEESETSHEVSMGPGGIELTI